MIAKSGIEAFLKKRAESYDWIKSLDRQVIEEAIDELDPRPTFHTKPFLHQLACFYLGVKLRSCAFFLKMGLGKSKIILDIFAHHLQCNEDGKLLILVPYLINFASWQDQIALHLPHVKASVIHGSRDERRALLDDDARIHILNYSGLVALTSVPSSAGKKKKSSKTKHSISADSAAELASRYTMLVLDESTAIKNHASLSFKAAKILAHSIPRRYILTGTPFGRNPENLWTQFYVVDFGETLGKTLGLYRAAFFTSKKNYWGGYVHTFDTRKTKLLGEKVKNKSIQYAVDECLDLPKMTSTSIFVDWATDAQPYYSKICDSMKTSLKQKLKLETNFMKLRQITSGFFRTDVSNDGDSDVVDVLFSPNPKLDALEELVSSIVDSQNDKFVIFHFFITTGKLISDRLTKMGVGHERLWSRTNDKALALRSFMHDDHCRALVLNEQVGALGLNLQVANYVIFFELPVSPIVREQAEARCRRPGQTKPVFCYDLVMRNSIDEKLSEYVKSGRDLLREVLNGSVSVDALLP